MTKLLTLFCSIVLMNNLQATTFTVTFGSALTYVPSSFNVKVGDIIVWNGSFGNHPLASTTIPAAAAKFNNSSGSTFSYTITAAGSYNYVCTAHEGSGMVGSFVATALSATLDISAKMAKLSVLNGGNLLNLTIDNSVANSEKQIQIVDVSGRLISSHIMRAGTTELPIDTHRLPSGIYIIAVRDDAHYILQQKFLKQ